METDRKELEQLLSSLKPSGLSDSTLSRLERAVDGSTATDASLLGMEKQLQDLRPLALSDTTLESWMNVVGDVPFALDRKVVFFPVARKETSRKLLQQSNWRRAVAYAAIAVMGALLALWTPDRKDRASTVGQSHPQPQVARPSIMPSPSGIVTTSFGTGIEHAADEGVIWTTDHEPKRVLRFEYQDRVLVRDKNGVDRMLFIPREELLVVPEKVD